MNQAQVHPKRFGGFALYVLEAKPVFCYNFSGGGRTYVRSEHPLPADVREVALAFDYDGGGLGRGGLARLSVDGAEVARGRIDRTTRAVFSMNEQLDIGVNRGSPVSEEFADHGRFAFSATLTQVRIDLPRADHQVSDEERRRIALATH